MPDLTWLIACEESGKLRDEMRAKGIDAHSCDLLPSRGNPDAPHHRGDVFDVLASRRWHGVIAFPPCTKLCVSGNRWYAGTKDRDEAVEFVERIWDYPAAFMGIENPIGVLSTKSKLGKPTQIIQPWQFGHGETKATCLWLRGLPPLTPTRIVDGREQRIWKMSPGTNRQRDRSETYTGIAEAMADQWSNYPCLT